MNSAGSNCIQSVSCCYLVNCSHLKNALTRCNTLNRKKKISFVPTGKFLRYNLWRNQRRTQRICFIFPKAHEEDAMNVLPISPQTILPFPVPGILSLSTASIYMSLEESLNFFSENNYST